MDQAPPDRQIRGLGVTHTSWQMAKDALRTHFASFVPAQVVTLTPEMCVRAQKDREFRSVLETARIVVSDGVGVSWGEGHLTGTKPEKVPGIDLSRWALEEVDRIAGRVWLIGSKQHVIEKTAERIGLDYPRLTLSGYHDGYFSEDHEPELVKSVAETNPHLVLVGMGSPKQEFFIEKNLNDLKCAVAIGVGGTFDVLSGSIRRAPDFFRATGTEWLYRIVTQPGERLGRLPELMRFVFMVLNWNTESDQMSKLTKGSE